MSITAKVKLESKESCSWDPSQVQLHFSPDYNDAFTLTFDKSEE